MPATLSWTGHSRADATPGRAAALVNRATLVNRAALVSCTERGPSRYWLGDGLDRWSASGQRRQRLHAGALAERGR